MGKTTLLFRFLEDTRETARTVFLFDIDAQCEPREFVAYILRDLGITPGQSSAEMHAQLSEALAKENRAGRKFVVAIDEAQNLSDAVLERVRLLTNFETSQGKLMHILLSGQPQLSDKLMQDSLVQLRQRISTVCHIDPLSAEETAGYIDYRVKLAGYDGAPLFTEYALELIAKACQGVPRTINNLCFNALSLCYAQKSKQVDGSMVTKAIADLELIPQSREPVAAASDIAAEETSEPEEKKPGKRLLKLWVPAAAVLLAACVLGVLGLAKLRTSQSRTTGNDHASVLKAPATSAPAPAAPATSETVATQSASATTPSEPGNAANHHISAPASAAAVQPAAPAHEPLQAKGPNPKPSAPAVRPAAPAHEPPQAKGPIPKPSAPAVRPAAPAHEPLQAKGPIPKPSAAAQAAATTLQTSATAPAPSTGAGTNPVIPQQSPAPSTGVAANPVTPQQSLATAGQSGAPTGAPKGGAATQVRPALAGNAQEGAQTAVTSNVRPALLAPVPLMVQIAAVAHTEDAEVLVSALRKRGYMVTTLREPADNLIHVRIGPFYSRDEADRWRARLLDDGYHAIIQP